MKKTTFILMAMAACVALFAAACGSKTAAPDNSQPAAPAGNVQQPQQPAQNFAPACQSANSCAAPDVPDTDVANKYCVTKIPYVNISVPPGTTFESLDSTGELRCQDSGTVVDGMEILTCYGKELTTYQLKLTNSTCSAASLQTGTGQCPDGQGFDAANNCCAPLSEGGSTIINVNIGACPSS